MMTSLHQQFRKHGFVHIPGVLSGDEVDAARRHIDDAYASASAQRQERDLQLRHLFKTPELTALAFKDNVTAAIRDALGGPFSTIGSIHIQRNAFGVGTPGSGWHTDSDSEIAHDYLWRPDFRFAKCGIYFQDNSREWGGGIDLVPGSHTIPRLTPNAAMNWRIKVLRDRFNKRFHFKTVPVKRGDLLVFDYRMHHKASWPWAVQTPEFINSNQIINIPDDHKKYVLYWDVGSHDSTLRYLEHSKTRAETERGGRPAPFFGAFLRYHFPNDFPDSFIRQSEEAGVEVLTLPADEASHFMAKHRPDDATVNPA